MDGKLHSSWGLLFHAYGEKAAKRTRSDCVEGEINSISGLTASITGPKRRGEARSRRIRLMGLLDRTCARLPFYGSPTLLDLRSLHFGWRDHKLVEVRQEVCQTRVLVWR